MLLNKAGLASLYPTINKIAANTDKGILLSKKGIVTIDATKSIPCITAAILVFPPDCMLAELRTITCVTGKPPIIPDAIFPIP